MAVEVKIPAVGESITSGIVSVWHKKSGDFVNAGDALFTLETDKVSTEIAAETAGVLDTIAKEGQEVKIGEVVATIDDSKKSGTSEEKKKEKTEGHSPQSSPSGRGGAEAKFEDKSSADERLSPAVRRIVDEENLDPKKIQGTGPDGRITKGDALAAAQNRKSGGDAVSVAEKQTASPTETPREDRQSQDGRVVRKKMSPLRRKIAAQLVMAQHTAAILTTFNECDMTAVQELRVKSQDAFTKKHGLKLGFMSFFIKACVEALKAVPVVNGRIEDEDFIQNNFYDIGVAVGTERGLIVPIVRDADKKSFADLERDIAGFATKAREGKLKIEDLTGGTFTISNGGVYGSLLSTPILNPPQSGILGMHKIMPRPVAIDGKVEVRPMMYLALSYDHRAVDGKEAVTFLIKVKECIEDPKKLPLDF
ncbi:MAG TPA: 2-oxoglutarate dehydrogenase complex dihydrolipoyllysine-residue succinyltransferase [Chthoniobacterales bacterium]|jgi:2-oxoglutarate dehydrogenase E2 component (dihydrolipoamide succinyltransferase)|nr:2-oxoglutarate dehydrogenase complex dihydrolipoyllysine-residue succinyltransferase [Chthoniobacterales bacterium]